ncbi:MAG: ribosome biogenesis GTPase Der, partial [Proteobacteria bacterium]|nr:ribosome biogenesis GTPase Der [Pseudomonadota bacterium]
FKIAKRYDQPLSLLMIDATEGPTDQDARLAQLVIDRGRALILLINKWDLVKNIEEINSHTTEDALEHKLPHASWATRLFISAKTGKGVHRIIPAVEDSFASFNTRIPTPTLNRWLNRILQAHTPPQKHHHPVRLYYMTQNRVRPPTFLYFSNTPEGVTTAYKRYLANQLRESYGFAGTPLRSNFKKRRTMGEDPTS